MGGLPGFPIRLRGTVVLGLAAVLGAGGAGSAHASGGGTLVRLPGSLGCVARDEPPCAQAPNIDLHTIVVSPDGRHLYAASDNTVYTYARDPGSGALRRVLGRLGCVRHAPRRGHCRPARGLHRISTIRLSPNGRHLYAASRGGPAVAVLERNRKTGLLRQRGGRAGCVSRHVRGCARGRALSLPEDLAVSPDGRNLYVAAVRWGSVVVLQRNRRTGALRQPVGPRGCLSAAGALNCVEAQSPVPEDDTSIAVTPNGRSVVLATGFGARVITLRRGRGGLLSELRAPVPVQDVASTMGLAINPNGRWVYVTTRGGRVAVLELRGGAHPRLLPGRRGCLEDAREAQGDPCAQVRGLGFPYRLDVSPDGANVYVATDRGFVTLGRRRNGALYQLRGRAGCLTWRSIMGCARDLVIRYDRVHSGIVVSPDGRNVYSVGDGLIEVFRRTPVR